MAFTLTKCSDFGGEEESSTRASFVGGCDMSFFLFVGPLTEVNLPVDSLTKKVKGFAFITFMIPEHAVKAFSELEGTVFQVNKYPLAHQCPFARLLFFRH